MDFEIGRAKRGYRLQELTCSAVEANLWEPKFLLWNPEKVCLNGQRVLDFVDKVEFREVESSAMEPSIINGWDGTI